MKMNVKFILKMKKKIKRWVFKTEGEINMKHLFALK